MSDGLLTEKQAADYLGLTPRTLQLWRTRGGGPSYHRIGWRSVRYSMSDIENWLESKRFASIAQEPIRTGELSEVG